MNIEVRVPQLPESIADATLIAWRKKPGDSVQRDENLVDLETDKVVLEVPAPAAGVIREVKVQDGATVTSGQVLAVLEEGAAAVPAAKPGKTADAAADAKPRPAKAQEAPAAPKADAKAAARAAPTAGAEKLAPSVRRLVEEHHLDTAGIAGSGRDGRITKSDVLTHLTAKDTASAPAAAKPAAPVAARPRTGRRTRRAPRADDPSARADRGTTAAGAVDRGNADDLQRGRPDERQRAARPLQGPLREGARRPARLHVVLRQGVHRGAAPLPRGQCVGGRQRHRLSRVLRHRHRGLDRPRA